MSLIIFSSADISLPYPGYLTEEEYQALLDDDDVATWLIALSEIYLDPDWGNVMQRGGATFDATGNINVEKILARRSPRYNLNFRRSQITVQNTNDVPVERSLEVIVSILQHVLDQVLVIVGLDNRVRIVLDSNHLPRGAIFIPIINKN